MRTLEDYWKDFENFGFRKKASPWRIDYTLEDNQGSGGFSILGDVETALVAVSDCTLAKPFIIKEYINELTIEVSQYYTGSASYYQTRDNIYEFDYGLNSYVNLYNYCGYKRIEPNIRLINIGFIFREKFFHNLPIKLDENFYKKAAAVLNPNPIIIPKITAICNSMKECNLEKNALKMYIHGKSYEVFSLLYDYVYNSSPKSAVYLSPNDKIILKDIKTYMDTHFSEDYTIAKLTKEFAINQQKLVTGFKYCFNNTINGYTRNLRMTKALELLYDNTLSIAEIAQLVGYYGDGYFQKAFKKTYGTTPRQMRKEIQQQKL